MADADDLSLPPGPVGGLSFRCLLNDSEPVPD